MANTKQAQKMVRKTVTQTKYNKTWRTRVKNKTKILETALLSKDLSKKDLQDKYKEFQKTIDKTVSKGVYHKNKVNRIKKRMSQRVKLATNSAQKEPESVEKTKKTATSK